MRNGSCKCLETHAALIYKEFKEATSYIYEETKEWYFFH